MSQSLVDVMMEGRAAHLLGKGITCSIFAVEKVLGICSGGLVLLDVIAPIVFEQVQ